MGKLEGQKCSNTFSNGQSLAIRHTCLGNDGGVYAKYKVQPAGCVIETVRGQLCGELKAHTHGQIKGDRERQAGIFRKDVMGIREPLNIPDQRITW